ncbi:selenocysteine lyase [Spongiibacter sp. IMCC21906]|uniref:aminotransferase class V-fold PLP-dependent enzyme n=1 Tax=Spongiibacter sp. IMCC21906 TaxID=1620392 RepID=UPI00062DF368|nr:aminotransferase class V-fold PLP-dependent enzyme [Spongiibacter sp. IMCC21906]AKH68724.1 selenocysteine lyase [Spongiibacter sp. IMCC21906]
MDRTMISPIIVLGGDGYLGWPLALRLAKQLPQRQIIIVDNLSRRRWAKQLEAGSLTPILSSSERLAACRRIHNITNLEYLHLDVNSDSLNSLIQSRQPGAIYHLAQQCSAPLSMRSMKDALHTLRNNEEGNMRLLWAVKEHAPDCHIIKLGTFGEYAKSGLDIAEGYFKPSYNGKTAERAIPYPRQSDDFYHASKINDTNYISIACRMWGLRITDVMQSTIFGAWTPDIGDHEALYTRLDYDEYFGTVVNRFITQALCGCPLTVYGTGHQRTGLMSLNDSVTSMSELWSETPAPGQHRVINHLTEASFSINELADTVKDLLSKQGIPVDIQRGEFDPRQETEQSKMQYSVERRHVQQRGPQEGLADVISKTVAMLMPYRDQIDKQRFAPHTQWQTDISQPEQNGGEVITLNMPPLGQGDEQRWEQFRQQEFPYQNLNLNPGTLGSPATSVLSAIKTFHHSDVLAYPLGQYGEGRKALLNTQSIATSLWPSTSHQLQISSGASQCSNLLALNLARQAAANGWKMRVLTTPHEHIGGTGAFERLPEFEVHYLSKEEINNPDAFAKRVAKLRPDVAFFSHIAYDSAYIFPVDQWGKTIKDMVPECCVIFDVSQSLGLIPPPLEHADAVFGSCHKWLFGPRGSGMMWTTQAFRERAGALHWSGAPLIDEPGATGFSPAGGMDFSVLAGVEAALTLHQRIGDKTIRQRGRYLANNLRSGLSDILDRHDINHHFLNQQYSVDCEAGVVTVAMPEYDPYPLYQAMNQQGVHCKCIKDKCKTGEDRMLLRFGVPFYETETRIESALSTIEGCIKSVSLSMNPSRLARQASPH